MSEVVNGVVEARSIKDGIKTKFGPRTKYSFKVNGDWYGALESKALAEKLKQVNENDIVKITYSVNGDFKNLEDVEVVAQNVPVQQSVPTKTSSKVSQEVAASVQTLAEKELRISYNGSLKSAIAFVEAAAKLDLLALPTKKAEKLDAFYEYVVEYTNKFVRDTYLAKLNLATEEKEETTSEDTKDVE